MAKNIYWLNFRIDDDVPRKPSHKQRYEALVEVVEEYALTWWRQSPSLYVIETDIDIDRLTPLIKPCINPESDFFMLAQMGKEAARIYGKYNDKDILKMMPYMTEL